MNDDFLDEGELQLVPPTPIKKKVSDKRKISDLKKGLLDEIASRDLSEFTNSELISAYRFVITQGDRIAETEEDTFNGKKIDPEKMTVAEYKEYLARG
jgi:hypothetical protein